MGEKKFENHPPFQWLVDTAVGDASPEVSGAVLEHLKECDRCRADYEWLVEVAGLASQAPGAEPPREVVMKAKEIYRKRAVTTPSTTNILERIGGLIMSTLSPKKNKFAFAALLVLVLSIAAATSFFVVGRPGVAHAAEVTNVTGKVEALLPSGERVTLRPGDTIPEDAVIVADANASAVITLPNGATTTVYGGSVVYLNKSDGKASVELSTANGNVQVDVDKSKGELTVETPAGAVHITKTGSVSVTVVDDKLVVVRSISGTVQVKTSNHQMTVATGHMVTIEVPSNAKGVLPKGVMKKVNEKKHMFEREAKHNREPKHTPMPKATAKRTPKHTPTPKMTQTHEPKHTPMPKPTWTHGPKRTPMPKPTWTRGPKHTPVPKPTWTHGPKHTPMPKPTRTHGPKHTPMPKPTARHSAAAEPTHMPGSQHPTVPFGGWESGHK